MFYTNHWCITHGLEPLSKQHTIHGSFCHKASLPFPWRSLFSTTFAWRFVNRYNFHITLSKHQKQKHSCTFHNFLDLIKSPSNNTNNHCTKYEFIHYKRRPHCNAPNKKNIHSFIINTLLESQESRGIIISHLKVLFKVQ